MTRILNEKWLTKVDFSKGVIELTEWEEKIYQQGKADAIEEYTEYLKKNFRIGVNTIDEVKKSFKEQNNNNTKSPCCDCKSDIASCCGCPKYFEWKKQNS